MKNKNLRDIIQLIGFSAIIGGGLGLLGWSVPAIVLFLGFTTLFVTCHSTFLDEN